jgi:putative tryptophan/tyrosine transport system substrate-binding protein
MRRRDFIALLGGAAAAWPLEASAQQGERMRRVGVLMGAAGGAIGQLRLKAFQEELDRLGWTEGRNVTSDVRWAEGRSEQFADIIADFVRLKADVIVTQGTPSTITAKQETSTIPIVFVAAGDPVGSGLVASLARPGGNVTGMSGQNTDVAGKRVELLREIFPGLKRLGVLMAAVNNPAAVLEMREIEQAAHMLGVETVPLPLKRGEDIAPAVEAQQGAGHALYAIGDTLINANPRRINITAVAARLPTVHAQREQVDAGGLMSYGTNFLDRYRRAADYVDKILRGTKPADIPVEQPSKWELVVNLTTARALGLTVPQTLLVAADEVLE